MSVRADNSRYVIDAANRRKDDARRRVLDVLKTAHETGSGASIAQIAGAAGVSRTYLYSQPDLLAAARRLQASNRGRPEGVPTLQRATTASLLARIEVLTTRNGQLREENRRLRRRLETAYGQLRESTHT